MYTGNIVNVYVEQKYSQNNENFIIYTPKSRQNKSPEQQCQQ